MAEVALKGQEGGTLLHPAPHGNERGKEPSQAYRQNLKQRVDAIYVNLGTLPVALD